MSLPWKPLHNNKFSPNDRKHYAAQLASVIMELIGTANAPAGFEAAAFNHAVYNKWFTPGNNPVADYKTDPREYLDSHRQYDTLGYMKDNTRATRGSVKYLSAEMRAGTPALTNVGTKEHINPWSDNDAKSCASDIVREATVLLSALHRSWEVWGKACPTNHPLGRRCIWEGGQLHSAFKTLKGTYVVGPRPAGSKLANLASALPAILFVCQVCDRWVIVGILNQNVKIPSAAEFQAANDIKLA